MQASFCEGELRADDAALEKLGAAFFAKAGRGMEETLSLEDFSFVLWSRSEIRQSLQFGNLTSRSQAKADLHRDMDALSTLERLQSKALMALRVSPDITLPSLDLCPLVLMYLMP